MRTKHLFTALALVALFASCAKEEFAPVSSVESSERAVVENVSFNFVEDATTRLVYTDGYEFEAGDQLGACLMDEITPAYSTSNVWSERFEFVKYIQTNYKFTRDAEGNWETEAKLCEGNYFLAYPYNKNMGLREAYSFDCSEQTLEGTNTVDLKKAYVKNNSFVGYAPVEASNDDHESVDIDMVSVFKSTGLTLKNTGTDSYTIEKVVLSGSQVSSYAVVDPTNTTYKATGNNKDVLKYEFNKRIDVSLEGGNTVNRQGTINILVMTAEAPLTPNVKGQAILEIHTDKGLIRGIALNDKQTAGNGILGDENEAVNVLTDKALPALGKADKVTITFDDTSLDIPNAMDIYSTDELYRLIKWNALVNNVDVIATLKANVELTAEMYEILKNSGQYGEDKSTLTIIGGNEYTVTVEADVEADAMDLVSFNGVDVYVEGTQTITNAITVDVFVEENATFNVAEDVAGIIDNSGIVNVTAESEINELINRATATVNGDLTVKLINLGTMTVNAGVEVTANDDSKNYGTLNNSGILDGSLKNMEEESEYEKVEFENPVVNNYGKILDIENNNVIVMKDKEARIQEANGEGEIDNTIQSDYIAAGVENTVFVRLENKNITAVELNTIALNADATKAYISGTLTGSTKANEQTVGVLKEVVAEGDLTINSIVKFSESPSFTVMGYTETIVENGAKLDIANGLLTIENHGLLTIKNNGNVLCGTYTGNVENYGTLSDSEKVIVSGVTFNVVSTDAELEQALKDGKTNIYLNDGEYKMPTAAKGKTLAINGSNDARINVVPAGQGEAGGQLDYNLDGSTVTFNGITIKTNNKTYAGYARLKATFNNCIMEQCFCLNGNSEFNNCTLNVSGDQYNIWTWGAPIATFDNCTFNSDGKALLLYGQANTKLTVSNCVFNDNGGLTALKAAIEIGNDYNKSYELIVNNTIVNGYEINDEGIPTGTTLWANKNSMGKDKLDVIVDGVDVY